MPKYKIGDIIYWKSILLDSGDHVMARITEVKNNQYHYSFLNNPSPDMSATQIVKTIVIDNLYPHIQKKTPDYNQYWAKLNE